MPTTLLDHLGYVPCKQRTQYAEELKVSFKISLCQTCFTHSSPFRDGGLKRATVKEAYKEEQQRLYSKVLLSEQRRGGDDEHSEEENLEG